MDILFILEKNGVWNCESDMPLANDPVNAQFDSVYFSVNLDIIIKIFNH